MRKRSIRIGGHATSVSLEDEFWDALTDLAAKQNTALSTLIARIDEGRGTANLSSALRVYVLNALKSTDPAESASAYP